MPKRLTLSEVLELVLTRSSSDRSTVNLTRTAAGEVTIDVKVSHEDVARASELAQAEYERLAEVYPRSGSNETPTVSLTRNAKGETQIDVKGPGWPATKAVYDSARRSYPMLDGRTAKPGTVDESAAS